MHTLASFAQFCECSEIDMNSLSCLSCPYGLRANKQDSSAREDSTRDMEGAGRLLLMGASLLSPSLTLLWAGLLGLGLLGGAGLPSHSRSERSVQLPAQGLICCSCGEKSVVFFMARR